MSTASTHTYSAAIIDPAGNIPLPLTAGGVSLDASSRPHVTATITIALPIPELLEKLDPRASRRVELRADATFADGSTASRVFDLGIRSTSPNRADSTALLQLASDEEILGDFAQLVDDDGARAHQASLRGICNYVLGKIGAALQPGTLDADMTAKWDATNVLVNPNVNVNIQNWISTGTSQLVRNTPNGFGGIPGYVAATASNANYEVWPEGSTGIGNAPAIRAGAWYSFSAYTRIAAGAATAFARIYWWDDAGGLIGAASGPSVALSSAWQRVAVVGTAPPNAVRASALVRFTGAVGNVVHVDAAILAQGRVVPDYFDGATADTADYDYSWTGTANASNSTRTLVVDAPEPEALLWPAGVSGMDFLHPLLMRAGFRLVCDELRRWTLRNADYRAEGNQTYRHGGNIETADETLSREDGAWCDAAVYEYVWAGRDGIERRRIDTFALNNPPSKVMRVELRDTPYPGAGRAESVVRRAQGRGRTVTVSAIPTWQEHTDQALSIVLEGTPIQTGIANRIDFDFNADTVTATSNTTDTPADAWILVPDLERWIDAQPPEGTWIGD